jgi:hypothetical protein
VKRKLSLGEGLRLIPTSEYETEQLKKAVAERRAIEPTKKVDLAMKNKVEVAMGKLESGKNVKATTKPINKGATKPNELELAQ